MRCVLLLFYPKTRCGAGLTGWQKIKDDPGSEEVQGKNLVKAAFDAGVQCFIWSSLPSSAQISGGRLVSKIYEGT
jgi:hypothetical protein